jgi:uncharacterized membrane protein YeaQ/YmgE (transglycosylase-associated protein family)
MSGPIRGDVCKTRLRSGDPDTRPVDAALLVRMGEVAMNFVAYIAAGVIIGWLVHRFMNDESNRLGYLAVGVLGAFAGVQLLAPMFGPPAVDPNAFSMLNVVSSAAGAGVVLIAGTIVMRKLFR